MTGVGKQNLLVTASALLIFALLFTFLPPAARDSGTSFDEKPSTFNTSDSGTKAIYLVLKRFLPSVERWMKPLEFLPPPEADNPTSLLVMGPSLAIGEEEAERLNRWIEEGGQLIVASENRPAAYLAAHGFSFIAAAGQNGGGRTASRRLERYVDGTGELLLEGNALEQGDYTVLFHGSSGIKGGETRPGAGRLLVIADKEVWSNLRLTRGRNAAWLVSAVLSWGNGRLLIDEYHHGFQRTRGPLALMLSFFTSAWGLAFVQLGAAGLLFLYGRGRRFGRIRELPRERKRDPLERVEALGALLEAAGASGFALNSISRLALRRLWRSRYGSLAPKEAAQGQGRVPSSVFPSTDIAGYLTLVERLDRRGSPSGEELLEAARRAGEIVQEYHHGRKNLS
jgi:hypothetical protein